MLSNWLIRKNLMRNGSPIFRVFAATLTVIFIVICASAVVGQSGRRVRRSTSAPVPTPEPTATREKAPEKPKATLTFIIGLDKYGDFSRIPLYTYTGVLRSCAERLDDADWVKVEIATRDMGRADAVLRAKTEKAAYVVWLHLRPDTFRGDSEANNADSNNVYLEYSVFAPVTAKLTTSGRTYPQAYRNKRVILSPKSSPIYGDYLLNQAARDAAERILAALKIHTPPDTRP